MGVKFKKNKKLLPAPGILRLANVETLSKIKGEYELRTAYELFWTDDDQSNIADDGDGPTFTSYDDFPWYYRKNEKK